MEAIKTFFTKIGIDENTWATIAPYFKSKTYKKGSYFAVEGEINPHIGFIEKGVFQYFFLQHGNEITTYVVGQNGWVASLLCILNKQPARENIRAATTSIVWQIKYDDFMLLTKKIPALAELYVKILEYQIICIDESRFGLLTQSAEERYQNLLEKEPQLLQQLPLQFLASTLGITPRHLSRIRKNIR